MNQALFIELWTGLRDLLGDNNDTSDNDDAKRFINWTMRDLANEYDWEFLRGSLTLTATGGAASYSLDTIYQLTASAETLYAFSDATADGGSTVTIYGKQIAASSNINISSDSLTLIATATATGGISFSQIDSIRRAVGSGDVTIVTSTGGTVATITSNQTYIANDLNKVNIVTDVSNNKRIYPYDINTYEKGNPDSSNLANVEAYDIDYEGNLRLFNVDTGVVFTVYYQRTPRYLINDCDRTEFPDIFNQKIINACYEGYGLRYRDQADANLGKARYKMLLGEIVEAWNVGKDMPRRQVTPGWYKRKL